MYFKLIHLNSQFFIYMLYNFLHKQLYTPGTVNLFYNIIVH